MCVLVTRENRFHSFSNTLVINQPLLPIDRIDAWIFCSLREPEEASYVLLFTEDTTGLSRLGLSPLGFLLPRYHALFSAWRKTIPTAFHVAARNSDPGYVLSHRLSCLRINRCLKTIREPGGSYEE